MLFWGCIWLLGWFDQQNLDLRPCTQAPLPKRSKGHRDMPREAQQVIFGEDLTNPLGLSKIDRKCCFWAVFGCWAGLISKTFTLGLVHRLPFLVQPSLLDLDKNYCSRDPVDGLRDGPLA